MSQPIIEISNISKCYRIGAHKEPYLSLRDTIVRKTKHIVSILCGREHLLPKTEEFWALRNVSFCVNPGECVGIIGRNGAGKSTLLKILSQITPPTTGNIICRGRTASLLEVGTGFHPELTGRENIYLNGTILGMTRAEITKKFDEIVAFSEIETFLDTPVKRYSSGMYVRLAFAVAAHLEPEILVVDEVLAVGDAEFQKKCLGKMQDVTKGGRTVLFVSHNMAAIQKLCTRGVLLDHGTLAKEGDVEEVVNQYLQKRSDAASHEIRDRTDREGQGDVIFTDAKILVDNVGQAEFIPCGAGVTFELNYHASRHIQNPIVYIGIYDMYENQLIHINTMMTGFQCASVQEYGKFTCHIPELPLSPGNYRVNIAMSDGQKIKQDRIESALSFSVVGSDYFGSGHIASASWGKFLVRHNWNFSQ